MANISICCVGGIGDAFLGFQCGHYVEKADDSVKYFLPVRDEIFRVIKYLFPDKNITQISEDYDNANNFEKDEKYRIRFEEEYGEFDNVYWVVPDLLYENSYAFDYKKYNVSPSTICSTRLLTHLRKPSEKIIYCALNSSTPEYQLGNKIRDILISIATHNPNYTIFFNSISTWANKNIDNGDLTNLPSNVNLHFDLDFLRCLEILKHSDYVISVDCGIYHISKNMGIDLLLLDARLSLNNLQWWPRWRGFTLNDSIPCDTSPEVVGRLVNINLTKSSTTLIPKYVVAQNIGLDWDRVLGIKRF